MDGFNTVNGTMEMLLRLYDDPAAGNLLYADSNTVSVVDGLYTTFLGDGTIAGTLTGALTNAEVYLEMKCSPRATSSPPSPSTSRTRASSR